MAGYQNFRSALNGFNRGDVVSYIEYLTNQHKSQIAQLTTQLQNSQEALAKAEALIRDDTLPAQLEAAQARCAELEKQLAAAGAALPAPTPNGDELETYRRAERVERMAQERASQIYAKANAALADATAKVEAASSSMKTVSAQLTAQLQSAEQQLQDAVSTMYAIRPEEN